jgi:hypothetical protein
LVANRTAVGRLISNNHWRSGWSACNEAAEVSTEALLWAVPPFVMRRCALAAAGLVLDNRTAGARDLAAVSGFVAPAYVAMNLATICAGERGWITSQPRGARGVAIQYAEHIKDEAIQSLTFEEASTVLRTAANVARATCATSCKG